MISMPGAFKEADISRYSGEHVGAGSCGKQAATAARGPRRGRTTARVVHIVGCGGARREMLKNKKKKKDHQGQEEGNAIEEKKQ
jgi:hypothetical protein